VILEVYIPDHTLSASVAWVYPLLFKTQEL